MSETYYTCCSELPLWNFIKIVVTDDLNFLIRPVKNVKLVSKKKLEELWEVIFAEYIELSGDTKSKATFSIVKEIVFLNNKLAIIQATVDVLAKYYIEELTLILREMGFKFKFDPEKPDQYMADLKRTVTQSKTLKVRIDQRQKELDGLKGDSEVKEADYEILLVELSRFQGYRLNAKEITVSEFIAILTRFKQSIKPNGNGKNR